jgi:enolase-phosphatase E1
VTEADGTRGAIGAVVFDIEGTTTAIAFVVETLFPYARRALGEHLHAHWADPAVRAAAVLMGSPEGDGPEAATRRALELMDRDVKDTGLKELQGRVWAEGYARGELRAHVFPEVGEVFAALRAARIVLAIYSSGSVAAQRLLFAHSILGDLTPYLGAYFDTTTGPKKDPASYRAIASALGLGPHGIAFVTDHLDEARAAQAAGWTAWVAVRPGNAPLPDGHGFPTLTDFRTLLGALGPAPH